MRIGELSRRTGVPVPTIKYYLREGLLPPGELSSPNQASYDDRHVHRLKLVRALVDVGELSIAAAKDVLAAIDSPGLPVHSMLGRAQRAVISSRARTDDESRESARREVAELFERRGWAIKEHSVSRQALVEVLATLRSLGHDDFIELLDDYAAAATTLATAEIDWISQDTTSDVMVERAIVGTVLGDSLMITLRRLAQEHESATRFLDDKH